MNLFGGREGEGGREGGGAREGGREGRTDGRMEGEGGRRGREGREGGMTVIHILIGMFNSNPMAVFVWAISWSTLEAWSTFRIRLVLHVIPWSTKDVRRNACDIFRS